MNDTLLTAIPPIECPNASDDLRGLDAQERFAVILNQLIDAQVPERVSRSEGAAFLLLAARRLLHDDEAATSGHRLAIEYASAALHHI